MPFLKYPKTMTETEEILHEVLNEIKLLREEMAVAQRPTLTTSEACRFLRIDKRMLDLFYKQGHLPSRYGGIRVGYKYSRIELQALQNKLMTGDAVLPKRANN